MVKITDIKCFKCKKRFGLDCPSRLKGESTLCLICFKKRMVESYIKQYLHFIVFKIKKYFNLYKG